MSNKNPINTPLHVFSSITGIYGWYVSAAKDSLSLWIMVVLSILYGSYCVFEYLTPTSFNVIVNIFKKSARYGLKVILLFISIYLLIYFVAPTFAKTNKTIVSIYDSEKLHKTLVNKSINKKPETQTWNEIIDGKDSCNTTPLIIKEIAGVTEEKAREFLSSLPHLNNKQRFVNRKNRDVPYLYWYTFKERETWNKDEEYMQEVNGSKANYNQLMKMEENNAKNYAKNFYKKVLKGYQKIAFQSFDIRPDSPYIVLYHEFESSKKNIRYEKRFKTFQTREYHIFIFRNSALDSYFNKNLQ